MKEDYLHYIWRLKKFDHKELYTSDQSKLELMSYGTWNHDAGPDFLDGSIRLETSLVFGHIEIHVQSSDWYVHKHQGDPKYDLCILHVVWEEDEIIYQNGRRIPCLELKNRISKKTLKQYYQLKQQVQFIPCERMIKDVDREIINLWVERMAIERLEHKVENFDKTLAALNGDWETLMYQSIAYYLGANKNKNAMLHLVQKVPNKLIQRYRNRPSIIEAILFGQGGFLHRNFKDDYPNQLKQDYQFLRQKYTLTPILPQMWNFFRMRPVSFPPIRISQFASFLVDNPNPFNAFLEAASLSEARTLLAMIASDYWDNHYVFDKQSTPKIKTIGMSMIDVLLINAIIPLLFFYGKVRNKSNQKDKAIYWQEQIKSEQNKIIKGFSALNFESKSAFQSQGLLQLKSQYCVQKRCLECAIGNAVLKIN